MSSESSAQNPNWLRLAGQTVTLATVAVGSYLLGRLTADAKVRACKGVKSKSEYGTSFAQVLDSKPDRPAEPERKTLENREVPTVETGELVRLLSQLPAKPLGSTLPAHSAAKAVLVCASGKGGVGKSTVSVNLAFMLKSVGLDVGLLDLDVYGPSLPSLVKLPPGPVMQNEHGRVVPLDYGGVALMSYGYIQPDEAATIRAPIVNQIVTSLLTTVEWGLLDVLIIDSPPGTGDVLLSMAQTLSIDGAVIVTTSNHISFTDVAKGLQLFEKVKIPPLLVVANMSTFCCESCGRDHDLFTDDSADKLPVFLDSKGIGLVKLPLDPAVSRMPAAPMPPTTREYPFVRNPDHNAGAAMNGFQRLTQAVLEALLGVGAAGSQKITIQESETVALRMRLGGGLEVRLRGGELRTIECGVLRALCRCAHCIDEFTQEVKIDCERIKSDPGLHAKDVRLVGNYAVNVQFSDGHNTIISLRALEQIVGGGSASWKPPAETKDNGW